MLFPQILLPSFFFFFLKWGDTCKALSREPGHIIRAHFQLPINIDEILIDEIKRNLTIWNCDGPNAIFTSLTGTSSRCELHECLSYKAHWKLKTEQL